MLLLRLLLPKLPLLKLLQRHKCAAVMAKADTINIDTLFAVARVAKSYHTDGEVVIKITSPFFDAVKRKDPLFIFFNGLPVPFFIVGFVRRGNSGAIVKFSTVRDFAHSEELVGKDLYADSLRLPKGVQKELAAESFQKAVVGYRLFDENNRYIGDITDYIEYPNNSCIEVRNTLLPFNEELIIDVDIEGRTITMQIPAGLLQ